MLDTKSSQKNERKPSLINSRSFAEHLSFFKHFMASTSQPSRMFSTHATYSAYNTCMYTEHLHHYDDYVCLLFTYTTCTEGISYRDNIIYLAIVGMDTHAHGAVGGLYAAHPNENCSFPSTFPPQGTMEKGEGSRSVMLQFTFTIYEYIKERRCKSQTKWSWKSVAVLAVPVTYSLFFSGSFQTYKSAMGAFKPI